MLEDYSSCQYNPKAPAFLSERGMIKEIRHTSILPSFLSDIQCRMTARSPEEGRINVNEDYYRLTFKSGDCIFI